MRAKRPGANGNGGETTGGEQDSWRNDPVPLYRYLPTKFGIHFLFNAENTNFCIFHAYTYFVNADHE